uniref:Crp/Fnr family transcriptional regulator n=1 Tax=Roseihalotalea indica TaxID=2867963 RepID=A0AA49JF43_9BACT|nr:Crp/Fnr family transcriptional regulator [Tunicatimonas sp. TK19036]
MNAILSTLPAWSIDSGKKRFAPSGLNHLQHDYEVVTYPKGHILFQEGHSPWGLYFIQKGKVKLYKYGSDGKEQIIRIAGDQEFLGYTALLNDMKYHVSAAIIQDAMLTFIPRQDFLDTFGKDSQVAQHFTHLLCRDLVETEQRLVAQAYRPVRGRLAEALLSLDNLYEQQDSDEESFIKLSRHDLASFLGTAKETVIRLLSEFKSENLITTDGQLISVLNPQGLLRISQMYE